MSKGVRNIVEDTFTYQRTKALWTASYPPAIPFSPQHFDIGSLLPAMLYMARWGHRRGQGAFATTFGREGAAKREPVTVVDVAAGLLARNGSILEGFDDGTGRTILGDLLLAWCLENRGHALGQDEPVQRVFPTHYYASWIDLPNNISHLRGAPEFLIALLANQERGDSVDPAIRAGRFPVATDFAGNLLLSQFGRRMRTRGDHLSDKTNADAFLEAEADDLGVDELLAVRLAQACGHAPEKAKATKGDSDRIPNQQSLARNAAHHLREDLAVFIEVYGSAVPRQAFLQMFEAGVALGLTNILLSTIAMLLDWEASGRLPTACEQRPWPLFVDASHGQDVELRALSEASAADAVRRYERLPTITMLLRLLEDQARDLELKSSPARSPDATDWINLLGDLLHGRHGESEEAHKALRKDCRKLAGALEEAREASAVADGLRDGNVSPALRLAEGLVDLMGNTNQRGNYMKALESCFMSNQPHGLSQKRRVRRSEGGAQRPVDLRSIVLPPALLDFLVHRHLRKATKGRHERLLSLRRFLDLLRDSYGLHVDREPPGLPVPQVLLQRNKAWLERRLRDLGLLVGVNDAESMKQLQARYRAQVVAETSRAQ